MNGRRNMLAERFMAPRALAVLSCALALLAVQPVAAAASHVESAVPAVQMVEASRLAATSSGAVLESRGSRKARRQEDLFASARRFHILATFEIFKRLLLAELRPMHSDHAFAAMECFVPLPLESRRPAPQPLASPQVTRPPGERQFAIEHCLSAPPIA